MCILMATEEERRELKAARMFCKERPLLNYPNRKWKVGDRFFYRTNLIVKGDILLADEKVAEQMNFNQDMIGDAQMIPFIGEIVYIPTLSDYIDEKGEK